MQEVSALYTQIMEGGGWHEVKLSVNGVDYAMDKIISMSTSHALFDRAVSVGNTIVGTIDVQLIAASKDIPTMAELRPYVRAVNDTQQSEWLPYGVYYIDTREYDKETGILTLAGMDAMLKGEQDYMQRGDQGYWPKSDIACVEEISERLGLGTYGIDPRTRAIITRRYSIGYPGIGEGAYTVREVLGYIGAMYAGNWIITEKGELRLIVLGDIPEETNYFIDESGNIITLGGDRLVFV